MVFSFISILLVQVSGKTESGQKRPYDRLTPTKNTLLYMGKKLLNKLPGKIKHKYIGRFTMY